MQKMSVQYKKRIGKQINATQNPGDWNIGESMDIKSIQCKDIVLALEDRAEINGQLMIP